MDEIEPLEDVRIDRSWLVILGDLLCLLLTFFVMMAAMQKIDAARWAGVASSLSRSLDPQRASGATRPLADRNAGVLATRPASDLAYLDAVLAERIRDTASLANIKLERADEQLTLALPEEPPAELVAGLAAMLDNLGNGIAVRAFGTDGRGAAIERAEGIAAALRNAGYGRNVPALGLVGPRRIEIVVREGRSFP
jgi:chemotaxis protein MotB